MIRGASVSLDLNPSGVSEDAQMETLPAAGLGACLNAKWAADATDFQSSRGRGNPWCRKVRRHTTAAAVVVVIILKAWRIGPLRPPVIDNDVSQHTLCVRVLLATQCSDAVHFCAAFSYWFTKTEAWHAPNNRSEPHSVLAVVRAVKTQPFCGCFGLPARKTLAAVWPHRLLTAI